MSTLPLAVLPDRAVPFYLYLLYLITSFRVCRYSVWQARGAPNPFLPRSLRPISARYMRELRVTV